MKTVFISEVEGASVPDAYTFDVSETKVKDCTGCWTCWWTTPGRCVFHDLDEFYHEYITADRAVYLVKPVRGFVSGNIKTLFDRMIPLYLPYTSCATGESMHVPRYKKYPDIEFYYGGNFDTPGGQGIFEDYINRVFYQFHSKVIALKPAAEFPVHRGGLS